MASLGVNERLVKLVRVDQSIAPAVSASALDAGTVVAQGNDGRYAANGAGEDRGFVLETVLSANAPISPMKRGYVDLGGSVLAAYNPGATIYATGGGILDDAPNSGGTTPTNYTRVGYVHAGRGDLGGDGVQRKLLYIDL